MSSSNVKTSWYDLFVHRLMSELSRLIENRLGLMIDPSQVRLQPTVEDGYVWRPFPEKEHLFKKQLSKHSVGAYMELCRDVGRSFEATKLCPSGNMMYPESEGKSRKTER